MRPVTIEEEIICYADKFFSKNDSEPGVERPVAEVIRELEKYGKEPVRRFLDWVDRFEPGLRENIS